MASAPPRPAAPLRPATGASRRGALLIVLLALGVSLLVITPLALISLRQEALSVQEGPALTLEVVADEAGYTPREIVVPRGANVRIDFVNRDPANPHDLQTFGQRRDVRVLAWPGETSSTVFKSADRPGRYSFLATIRGQAEAGYSGTILVQ
jgi:Cupredoxin-like domain